MRGARRLVPLLRRAGRQARGPADPAAEPGLPRLHPARAGRRGRRDHAVELAAAADDLEARPGAGGRAARSWSSRPSTRRPRRSASRELVDRGRVPAGRGQRRHRAVPGDRRGAGRAPGRGQGRVHRLDRDRAARWRRRRPSNLNKVTLELGGKSPQVVFPDADLDAAANGLVAGVFAATGQTCMAGSRLIVHADVHDELVRLVAERAARDPARRPDRPGHRDGPGRQPAAVREGRSATWTPPARGRRRSPAAGADAELGGLFVRPTVLTGVDAGVDGRPRGGVRAGAGRAHVHRRGRGGQAGQRHPVRAGRRGLDQGRAPRPPGGRRGSGPAPSGSTPTGWSRRTCRSAASGNSGHRPGERHARGRRVPGRDKAVWVELTGGTRDPFILG